MNKIFQSCLGALAFVVLVMPVGVACGQTADEIATEQSVSGIVNGVYPEDRQIVVDDLSITYDPGLVVHDTSGAASVGPGSLRRNMPIRFLQSYRDVRPYTKEIWVLESLPQKQPETSADED